MGALVILGAFALNQAKVWTADSLPYLAANLLGSFSLAVVAVVRSQVGFLLIEGGWALISLVALVRVARPGRLREARETHPSATATAEANSQTDRV